MPEINIAELLRRGNPTGRETLAEVVSVHAQTIPDKAAFIAGERRMSWRQYRDWSDQLAAAFIDAGLERGERIGLLMPDACEVHVAYLACEKAGLVGVALPSRAGEKEISHLLTIAGASAVLVAGQRADIDTRLIYSRLQQSGLPLRLFFQITTTLDQPQPLWLNDFPLPMRASEAALASIAQRRSRPDELFLLNSTSGTTGMPKSVMQHQGRWFHWSAVAQDSAPMSGDDVFLRAIPSSVGFGLWTGHFIPTLLGATTIVLPKFSVEEMLKSIETHKVSVLAAVSTQFIMMLNATDLDDHDLSSLRVLYTGGEAVPYQRAAEFEEKTGASVLQFYGSNETGALSYTTSRDSREKRLTTAGRTIDMMQVRLIDERGNDITASGRGQPVCKGPLTCHGYYNNGAANKKLYMDDGWMKMEDIATIDSEGYMKVVGRVGDFIIRGGKNISSAAVEEAVLTHPKIKLAAVVAMPDPVFGERVCAYVTLEKESTLAVQELADFLKQGGYSREYFPEHLIVMDDLPIVSGGKVAKHILRDDIKKRVAEKVV